jgi:hypothetical protein
MSKKLIRTAQSRYAEENSPVVCRQPSKVQGCDVLRLEHIVELSLELLCVVLEGGVGVDVRVLANIHHNLSGYWLNGQIFVRGKSESIELEVIGIEARSGGHQAVIAQARESTITSSTEPFVV